MVVNKVRNTNNVLERIRKRYMEMIPFIIGLIIGLFIGTSIMCCVIVSKEKK